MAYGLAGHASLLLTFLPGEVWGALPPFGSNLCSSIYWFLVSCLSQLVILTIS